METSTEGEPGTPYDAVVPEPTPPDTARTAVPAQTAVGRDTTAGGGDAGPAAADDAAVDGAATDGADGPDGGGAAVREVAAGRPVAHGPAPGGREACAAPGTDVPGGDGDSGVGAARAVVPPGSLSPSRAGDFMQCPLLYRFRVIDRLPEKPSEAATRGTLVHAVLERLFDAPAAERTAPRAKALVPGQWQRLREARPELLELFADDTDGEQLARWLAEAERLVERWFTLEDPTRLEPAERELFVEAELDSGLTLRGIIDRVDVAPTGEVRIVDYKTGKAPRPEYAEGALFQMKFYALVVWRLKKVLPRRLQLVYLGSGDVLTYDPVLADLERVERKLLALWEAIRLATETGDWRPRPTKLCGWCDHQAHCPEFGGTPPPYPLPLRAAESGTASQGRMGPD
ncbi:RecB family exonuclease [Streptomyces cyslabdanicus]|uniref:RecB family exonuclease n=1 Tax=Streptomyces cyslabdanicus TaxID=1470456 RepID=UPI00404405CE